MDKRDEAFFADDSEAELPEPALDDALEMPTKTDSSRAEVG